MVKRLLFVVNDADYFLSHRLPIALSAVQRGYEVHIATPKSGGVDSIKNHGLIHHPIPLSRHGIGLIGEILALIAIYRLFRRIQPDLVHLVAIKPVLYGAIAAQVARVPSVIAAISGLGPAFSNSNIRSKMIRPIVKWLFQLAFNHKNLIVIFQNSDDKRFLQNLVNLNEGNTRIIKGSGVDLATHCPKPEQSSKPVILMASRLVKDKGPGVFAKAAQIVHSHGVQARFQLAGEPDSSSTGAISSETLKYWDEQGIIEVLGFQNNIAKLLDAANLAVLPSVYGEGLPKFLVEAAACGRAIVTTDHPGCRDAILPNISGLLVPGGDAKALASAIESLIVDKEKRMEMGRQGRMFAERHFAIETIIDTHFAIYQELERVG